jgi:hypothetical protein
VTGHRRESGQASVELVAILPLATLVALAAGQALAAGLAEEMAGHASHAGAVAMLQGRDPVRAARAALPGWSRTRLAVDVDGRRVSVRVRPVALLPGLAGRVSAKSVAFAGSRP